MYLNRILEVGEEARALSPDRPHVYYLTGRAYMGKREFEKGLEMFKKAVELAPGIYDAHWNMFAAYATVGDTEGAEREIEVMKSLAALTPEQYRKIASVYISVRDYEGAERILKEAAEKFQNGLVYALLAEIYAVQGKNAEAREAALHAVELAPEIKPQVDQFLIELEKGSYRRTTSTS